MNFITETGWSVTDTRQHRLSLTHGPFRRRNCCWQTGSCLTVGERVFWIFLSVQHSTVNRTLPVTATLVVVRWGYNKSNKSVHFKSLFLVIMWLINWKESPTWNNIQGGGQVQRHALQAKRGSSTVVGKILYDAMKNVGIIPRVRIIFPQTQETDPFSLTIKQWKN